MRHVFALAVTATVLCSATPARAQVDFDECGNLMQGIECLLFVPDSGGFYFLEEFGSFGDGDYVHVVGTIDPTCITFCFSECIVDNTIESCTIGDPQHFVRGDTNGDGSYDISDPVNLLTVLFTVVFPAPIPPCLDAADANDDGNLDISDPVYILSDLFITGSPSPPSPHPDCGFDPTDTDPLDCQQFDACP